MQRRLTIALVATALVSIVLVGFGVLAMAQISARSNAENDVTRGLNIVSQFLDDQERTTRGVEELLFRSRRDFGLSILAPAVVDADGTLSQPIGRGTRAGAGRAVLGPLPHIAVDQDQLDALEAGETVLTSEGGSVIGIVEIPGFRTEGPAGIRLVVIGGQEVSAVSGRTLAWFLLSSLAVLAGAVVAGSFLARRLVGPLKEIEVATTAIAGGDLATRIKSSGTDEVADLGNAVNRMAEDLQRSKALDRQFLMSVSHDLKTPLTVISGYAEGLTDGAVTDSKAAGEIIHGQAARLDRLVGDLLDLAKLDANRFRFNPRPFDLAVVAGRTVAGQAKQAQELGLSLRTDGLTSAPVTADPDRTAQAIGNLIDNAIKFAKSEVVVDVSHPPSAQNLVTVAVRDDGPGIADADLEHIFDRLYTGKAQPDRAENPSGLGLAIVRELAAAMGGSVSAANNPGSGACLSLTLPISVAGPTDPGRQAATQPQTPATSDRSSP